MIGWIDREVGKFCVFSWRVGHAWASRMTNVLLQEFVEGGGIDKPSDSALYGAEDFPRMYGVKGTLSDNNVGTSPLALRDVFLSDISGRIRRGGPPIRGIGNELVETMLQPGCRLMHSSRP